jgi:hypothetical protein
MGGAYGIGGGGREERNLYKDLVVKCEGKRPLGRPAHKREKSVKTDPKEIIYEDVDWIDLAQNKNM